MYTHITEGHINVITIWVDDLILSTQTDEDMARVKGEMEALFNIKDLGPPRFILGIEIDYNHNEYKIILKQTAYIKSILDRYGMADC